MIQRSSTQKAGLPAEAALRQRIEREVDQMRHALVNLIEFSGMSQREVEQRLCQSGCGTDLGRLLSGRPGLKMKHVLALCRVIDLEPLEFVQIELKPRPGQRSPLLRRLEALLPYARAEAGPPTLAGASDVPGLLQRAHALAAQLSDLMEEAARMADPEGGLSPTTQRQNRPHL
jgi:hypothetical protein